MSTPEPVRPARTDPPAGRRTVLITGTSSGIGLRTAVAAARAGWDVVATMRDVARGAALRESARDAGVELDVRELDVTDEAAVTDVVAAVVADHGRLDAVVNNAGSATVGTAETLSLAEIRAAMEVNFFGVVQVTRAALPHLRAAHGRVLTISSVGGVVGQPFNDAYCAAKFAVEGFLESLAPVAARVGVDVVVVEPGAVASAFVENAGIRREDVSVEPYGPLFGAYLDRTSGAFASAQDPAEVAGQVVELLSADAPPFRVQTSPAATTFAGLKLADLDGSRVLGATAGWLA